MGVFKGIRTKNGAFVTYDDAPLDLRLDLKEHSPLGFEWGYNGSGSKQLALAILSKISTNELALKHYELYTKEIIEELEDNWILDEFSIKEWLDYKNFDFQTYTLTPRFKLSRNNRDRMFMYLDNKKLGKNLPFIEDKNATALEKNIQVYCDFSEINYLRSDEIPSNTIFYFLESRTREAYVSDYLTLKKIYKNYNELIIEFYVSIDVIEYISNNNGLFQEENIIFNLKKIENIELSNNEFNDMYYWIDIIYKLEDENTILKNLVDKKIDEIANSFKILANEISDNNFEATFNFPEDYQSILKPYMLYFEEFLNDLCIESDVSIRKEGLDTILSVEPKNKDEALEKIADALKLYISAPIVASDVSLEEKLQMQTALQKLHAQCTHLESQLVLKQATLTEQHKQLQTQQNVIDEIKRVLIEAGIKPERISVNNTMLIDSLKEVNFNQQKMSKNTFWKSIKSSIKVPSIFEATLEISREQFEKDK